MVRFNPHHVVPRNLNIRNFATSTNDNGKRRYFHYLTSESATAPSGSNTPMASGFTTPLASPRVNSNESLHTLGMSSNNGSGENLSNLAYTTNSPLIVGNISNSTAIPSDIEDFPMTPSYSSTALPTSMVDDDKTKINTGNSISSGSNTATSSTPPLPISQNAAPAIKKIVAQTSKLIKLREQTMAEVEALKRVANKKDNISTHALELTEKHADDLAKEYRATKIETIDFLLEELPRKIRRQVANLSLIQTMAPRNSKFFPILANRLNLYLDNLERLEHRLEDCKEAFFEPDTALESNNNPDNLSDNTSKRATNTGEIQKILDSQQTSKNADRLFEEYLLELEAILNEFLIDKPGGQDDYTGLQLLSLAVSETNYVDKVSKDCGVSYDDEFAIFMKERIESRFLVSQFLTSTRKSSNSAVSHDTNSSEFSESVLGSLNTDISVYNVVNKIANEIRNSSDQISKDVVEFDSTEIDEDLRITCNDQIFNYIMQELLKNANNANLKARLQAIDAMAANVKNGEDSSSDSSRIGTYSQNTQKSPSAAQAFKRASFQSRNSWPIENNFLRNHALSKNQIAAKEALIETAKIAKLNQVRSVSISTELVEVENIDGQFCAIRIKDEGCGIENEKLHKIFQFFYTNTHSDHYKLGGFGLGLPAARLFARSFGGDILIESDLGAGTMATLLLPVVGKGASGLEHGIGELGVVKSAKSLNFVDEAGIVRNVN